MKAFFEAKNIQDVRQFVQKAVSSKTPSAVLDYLLFTNGESVIASLKELNAGEEQIEAIFPNQVTA